jgi:beta-hydroxylase
MMAHTDTKHGVAYKILTGAQWAQWRADGVFAGAPVDLADGYIHLSAADQVTETVNRHFAGQSDLVLVHVDLAALGDLVRWEPSRGGALFPHVYGTMPLSVAITAQAVARDADNAVSIS